MAVWSNHERRLKCKGFRAVCGVDEAGRGPLAGPVVAAAVILPAYFSPEGIADSKQLSAARREAAFERITREAVCYAIAESSVAEIDDLNVLQATFLAMRRAVEALDRQPDYLLVDGNMIIPRTGLPSQAVIGGDGKVLSIACASILAKVHRDRIMCDYHQLYPEFGFDRHKGYATHEHRQMIARFGAVEIHRKSFNLLGEEAKLEFDL
jgi:ribonuclease HII